MIYYITCKQYGRVYILLATQYKRLIDKWVTEMLLTTPEEYIFNYSVVVKDKIHGERTVYSLLEYQSQIERNVENYAEKLFR
jgi:hypothetical protein